MEPNDLKDWLRLLNTQPLLTIILTWGVIELRRFLAAQRKHYEHEETLLTQIRDAVNRKT